MTGSAMAGSAMAAWEHIRKKRGAGLYFGGGADLARRQDGERGEVGDQEALGEGVECVLDVFGGLGKSGLVDRSGYLY